MFKPVKKTRIYEEIVNKIKAMVEKGELTAGRLELVRWVVCRFGPS
jgi:hypothetical protein